MEAVYLSMFDILKHIDMYIHVYGRRDCNVDVCEWCHCVFIKFGVL